MEALLLILVAIGAAIYFLPTIVAAIGNKRKTGAIFVLNLFLGWTLLGWVGALVWAVADERSDAPEYQPPAYRPPLSPAGNVGLPSTTTSPAQPTWRPLPTPGQRVHLVASHIVRVGPEMTAQSTGELRGGTDVTVVRTSGGWVWVQSDDGQEGWIQL